MSGYFFRTDKMSVGYHGVPLVKDIGLEIGRGEIVTLIGANGVGKSTILKNITAQLAPVAGTVYLEERSVHRMPRQRLAQNMSVVLTERVKGEWMSCAEVVAAGRYPYTGMLGILSGEDWQKVQETMETVGITALADKEFAALSDGQRQLAMLARALCQEPEVLVLDEPTSYLDMRYKLEVLAVLQRMARERGLTVIMSLHELELAQRISDKIVCVKGDCIHRYGTPEEIFTPGYIEELYDMKTGTYDVLNGRPELPGVRGLPRVFVLGGGGRGIPVYRRLQRQGIPFAAGILWENDLDYPVAADLAARVISEKAFAAVRQETYARAVEVLRGCEEVLCCIDEFGEWNQVNRELMELAQELGKMKRG